MAAPPPSPVTPAGTYPRPASIGSPVRNRWGVGRLTAKPGEVYVGSMAGGANKNVPVSLFDVDGAFAALSPAAQQKLYKDLESVYGYDNVAQTNLDGFLAKTVRNAYAVQQSTGLMVDPLSYWDYYRQSGGPGLDVQRQRDAAGGGGGGGGISRSTSRTESVDLTNPLSARSLADQALAKYLGRGATPAEFEMFTKALNAAERKSPNVSMTTSVTSRGAGGASSRTKSMSRGGVDKGRFAEEWAMSQEGAAEYAAATTVLDSFMKILGE